jgi:hypothetical protein
VKPTIEDYMTTQTQPRTISLSAELARSEDDVRHQLAKRWNAALHRLCVLRATTNETSYEVEWARIFDGPTLLADVQRSKLLCFAALAVLEIQHEHSTMFCQMEGIAYDADQAEECRELLAALRFKIENNLP